MEKRVEALEKAIPEIRERLVRVETKVDSIERNMVTKAEFAEFKLTNTVELNDFKLTTKSEINDLKLSTKKDINDLRVVMLEGFNKQTKWLIGTTTAFAGIVLAAVRMMQ